MSFRLARLLKIDGFLRSPHSHTAVSIAAELEVSERTIRAAVSGAGAGTGGGEAMGAVLRQGGGGEGAAGVGGDGAAGGTGNVKEVYPEAMVNE